MVRNNIIVNRNKQIFIYVLCGKMGLLIVVNNGVHRCFGGGRGEANSRVDIINKDGSLVGIS